MRKIALLLILLNFYNNLSAQTLQDVTNSGNSTNHPITAHSFNTYSTSFGGAAIPLSIDNLLGLRINGALANSSHNATSYQSGGGGGAALGFYRGGSYDTGIDF